MPKAKKYSMKCRSKGKRYNKTKRGGENTNTDEFILVEEGRKYDKPIPTMMNPMDIQEPTTNLQSYPEIPLASPEEVAKVFDDRSAKLAEIDKLTEKYEKVREEEKQKEEKARETTQQEIERLKAVKKMEKLNEKPLTKQEVIEFFDNPPPSPDDCIGDGCIVSGGKKSRRYRRKGSKSRRHRKSRKY